MHILQRVVDVTLTNPGILVNGDATMLRNIHVVLFFEALIQ